MSFLIIFEKGGDNSMLKSVIPTILCGKFSNFALQNSNDLLYMAKINVQNTQITVIKQNEDDYISLTDMLKAKDGEFFFSNWLRNRNTIEFLGIWEQ